MADDDLRKAPADKQGHDHSHLSDMDVRIRALETLLFVDSSDNDCPSQGRAAKRSRRCCQSLD